MGSPWILPVLSMVVLTTRAAIQHGDENERFLVLRSTIQTEEQLQIVREMHDNMHKYNLDFWLSPHAIGHKADIMVRESGKEWLENKLSLHGIPHFVSIPDVQKLILERERKVGKETKNYLEFFKRFNDEGGNKAKFGFGDYHSYDRIQSWLSEIERLYPDRAKVLTIGTTAEGRPIKTIKIGFDVASTERSVVWIDGGIHAREWAAIHTALYFIERMIADGDSDPVVREALRKVHVYITPVLNPDGYEYSRSGVTPTIRLWRKNRANMVCKKDQWFRDKCCGGVDLNRNFDWFFGEIGSSGDKCSEIYQGPTAFSEKETQAVRDTIFSPALKGKVDAFITMHTYSQMWIHPFSHMRKTVPEDINDLEMVGRRAVAALEATFGTKYRFGTGADILYPSAGGSDDWAKGKGGAKYVYLLELRPGEEVWDGFILDSRQLIPTGKETWNGVKEVMKAVLEKARGFISTDQETTTRTLTNTASTTTDTSTTSLPTIGLAETLQTTQYKSTITNQTNTATVQKMLLSSDPLETANTDSNSPPSRTNRIPKRPNFITRNDAMHHSIQLTNGNQPKDAVVRFESYDDRTNSPVNLKTRVTFGRKVVTQMKTARQLSAFERVPTSFREDLATEDKDTFLKDEDKALAIENASKNVGFGVNADGSLAADGSDSNTTPNIRRHNTPPSGWFLFSTSPTPTKAPASLPDDEYESAIFFLAANNAQKYTIDPRLATATVTPFREYRATAAPKTRLRYIVPNPNFQPHPHDRTSSKTQITHSTPWWESTTTTKQYRTTTVSWWMTTTTEVPWWKRPATTPSTKAQWETTTERQWKTTALPWWITKSPSTKPWWQTSTASTTTESDKETTVDRSWQTRAMEGATTGNWWKKTTPKTDSTTSKPETTTEYWWLTSQVNSNSQHWNNANASKSTWNTSTTPTSQTSAWYQVSNTIQPWRKSSSTEETTTVHSKLWTPTPASTRENTHHWEQSARSNTIWATHSTATPSSATWFSASDSRETAFSKNGGTSGSIGTEAPPRVHHQLPDASSRVHHALPEAPQRARLPQTTTMPPTTAIVATTEASTTVTPRTHHHVVQNVHHHSTEKPPSIVHQALPEPLSRIHHPQTTTVAPTTHSVERPRAPIIVTPSVKHHVVQSGHRQSVHKSRVDSTAPRVVPHRHHSKHYFSKQAPFSPRRIVRPRFRVNGKLRMSEALAERLHLQRQRNRLLRLRHMQRISRTRVNTQAVATPSRPQPQSQTAIATPAPPPPRTPPQPQPQAVCTISSIYMRRDCERTCRYC